MEKVIPTFIGLTLFTALAIIVLIDISQKFFSISSNDQSTIRPEIVIIVKNAQNQIEGIVRNFYQNVKNTRELWIVDRGSQDQTPVILEMLSTHFPGLNTLLLSDMSYMACTQEAIKYINVPALMFLDANRLTYSEIRILTNIAYYQKKCRNRSKNL